MIRNGLFSFESVSEGHADKLADRISDAILDEFLRHDPDAQVACETLVSDQLVVVVGEYHTIGMEFSTVQATAEQIVRKVLETRVTATTSSVSIPRFARSRFALAPRLVISLKRATL